MEKKRVFLFATASICTLGVLGVILAGGSLLSLDQSGLNATSDKTFTLEAGSTLSQDESGYYLPATETYDRIDVAYTTTGSDVTWNKTTTVSGYDSEYGSWSYDFYSFHAVTLAEGQTLSWDFGLNNIIRVEYSYYFMSEDDGEAYMYEALRGDEGDVVYSYGDNHNYKNMENVWASWGYTDAANGVATSFTIDITALSGTVECLFTSITLKWNC